MTINNKACGAIAIGIGLFVGVVVSPNAVLAKDKVAPAASGASEYPRRPLWGDTHVHTNLSYDAFVMGNTALGLEDAYRFARGEAVDIGKDRQAKLERPLDFLVISDHSDLVGVMADLTSKDSILAPTKTGALWAKFLNTDSKDGAQKVFDYMRSGVNFDDVKENKPFQMSIWQRIAKAADDNNKPGQFTAFIGYEWTSGPGGNNLHRNVIFRDDASKATRVIPLTTYDTVDPKDLWAYLADYEKNTGGQVLAIPHNGNLSNGLMFAVDESVAADARAKVAMTRMRWEPLYEVTQMKGDSETHPFLSPTDEFANFERWDTTNLYGNKPKEDWMLKFEYARSALKLGLEQQHETGVNPFKFGLVGGTDTHTSLTTADDTNFWGKMASAYPRRGRWKDSMLGDQENLYKPKYRSFNWQTVASGYTAVWATENTRAAIFDAMRRKETYASTGPRIAVRFFGGWDFGAEDAKKSDIASVGYRKGVSMGGDLTHAPKGRAPRFLIWAAKDPIGANLDRVQVVKGWVDTSGKAQEQVFDVALSGGRVADGKHPPAKVGNTVDLATATYKNTIGAAELAVVWQDPAFDPAEEAFYYVRVIEIPTPRWTAYDVVRFGDQMSSEVPMITQERAYTSPIWYEPSP